MLERFSVSVSAATILAVLGKIALLYNHDLQADSDWFEGPISHEVFCYFLVAFFLIFFRGKMMHDDASFFKEIEDGEKFKAGPKNRFVISLGVFLGYISWLFCGLPPYTF